MVGEPESVLGRLHRRRPARPRGRHANANRGVVSPARDPGWSRRELHVHARLALSQSNRRAGRAGPRRRATRTTTSGTTTATDSPTPGRRPSTRPPGSWSSRSARAVSCTPCVRPPCPGRCATPRSPISRRSSRKPLSAPPTAISRLRGLRRPSRLLPRQLHARLELRDRHALLFPSFARSLREAPSAIAWTTRAACDSARCCPTGSTGSGYAAADGQMGQIMKALSRLEAVAAIPTGCAVSGRRSRSALSSSPGFPAAGMPTATASWKASSTTPTTSSSTVRIRSCGSLLSRRLARRRGDGARARRHAPRQPTIARLFETAASGSTQNLFNGEYYMQQVRGIPKSKIAQAYDRRHGQRSTRAAGVPARRRLPRRSADRPISGGCRRPRPAAGTGQHPQDARIDPQDTTTARNWPITIRCSASTP